MPLILIMLSSGIIPFGFASVESEAQEDIQAGCRDNQTLVYRISHTDYVCVEPSTADRWEELGLAEIVDDYDVPSSDDEEIESIEPLTPITVPLNLERTTVSISDDSECREGYVLIYRFIHKDTFCTSPTTASSWERLGLAEIIEGDSFLDDEQIETIDDEQIETIDDEQIETIDDEQIETIDDEQIETIDDEQIETIDDEQIETIDDEQIETIDESSSLSHIYQLNHRIWIAIGYDVNNIVLIEGDRGIIVIDTLSSYESSKILLADFQSISEKPIKTIIFTMINPDMIQGSRAFVEAGDGSVEIVIDDELLDNYYDEYGVDFTPTHSYPYTFSLDISGVKIELYNTSDGHYSDQTYVSLPDDNGILIGDSKNGLSPYLLEMDYFRSDID